MCLDLSSENSVYIYIFVLHNEDVTIYIYHCYSVSSAQGHAHCQVNISFRHIFSVEYDDNKRAYIMDSNPNVEHVFSNVDCFTERHAWCHKCMADHIVTSETVPIHMYFVGPSCKDISTYPAWQA